MACAADLERSMAAPDSFQPPTLPGTGATARLPSWILLDKKGHIENRQNATEARSWTRWGQQVVVSFFTAEPPGLSHFSVHCPGLSTKDFATQPCVVHSHDNLSYGTLIGGQNTSWGSSTTQTPQENVNNWTTVIWLNHYAPNYGSYCSQAPILYANGTYPSYGNYHQQLQLQPQPLQLQPPLSVIMR